MSRRTPPGALTKAFHEQALSWYTHGGPDGAGDRPMRLFDGGPACWLWQFDLLERPCSGHLEAIHLLGRQRIRNSLRPQLLLATLDEMPGVPAFQCEEIDDLVELTEWDPRNGAAGCTGHHRRFDSQATPELLVPAAALPLQALGFITSMGLEADADRRFTGDPDLPVELVIAERRAQLEKHWGYQGAIA